MSENKDTFMEATRSAWKFIEEWYPNYSGSDTIDNYNSLEADIEKLLDDGDDMATHSKRILGHLMSVRSDLFRVLIEEACRNYFSESADNNKGQGHIGIMAEQERKRLESGITQLSSMLSEKRNDISECLDRIVAGEPIDPSMIEHRYASVKLPEDAGGKIIEYDTLTTMFSLPGPVLEYETVMNDHEYYDDYNAVNGDRNQTETQDFDEDEDEHADPYNEKLFQEVQRRGFKPIRKRTAINESVQVGNANITITVSVESNPQQEYSREEPTYAERVLDAGVKRTQRLNACNNKTLRDIANVYRTSGGSDPDKAVKTPIRKMEERQAEIEFIMGVESADPTVHWGIEEEA